MEGEGYYPEKKYGVDQTNLVWVTRPLIQSLRPLGGEIIVYVIVYEVNNHLFVRFLKGNALSKQSAVCAFSIERLFSQTRGRGIVCESKQFRKRFRQDEGAW